MKKAIGGLEGGLSLLDALLPLARQLGGGAIVELANLAAALLAIVVNLFERAKEGEVVFSSHDEAVLKAINAKLAAANDELAKYILNS
jgi:hypothetical protein